ncbi:unnamed protein product, partial [Polarella glacialis]
VEERAAFGVSDPRCNCAICRDTFVAGDEIRQLPCNHEFHGDCILLWLKGQNTCPICRWQLPEGADGDEEQEAGDEVPLKTNESSHEPFMSQICEEEDQDALGEQSEIASGPDDNCLRSDSPERDGKELQGEESPRMESKGVDSSDCESEHRVTGQAVDGDTIKRQESAEANAGSLVDSNLEKDNSVCREGGADAVKSEE